MTHILSSILEVKRHEVSRAITRRSLAEVRERALSGLLPRDFIGGLRTTIAEGRPAVIAEIKRASPSQGVIRQQFTPAAIARDYERHGASCISVLTDAGFFQGAPEHLVQARAATSLPVLRKDFLIDPYQIYESRALGADCILLIVAALPPTQLREFLDLTHTLGMDALVEVHTPGETAIALEAGAELIGINNRDLTNFTIDIGTTISISSLIPNSCLKVSESGIAAVEDVRRLREQNIDAFLVGEAFMRSPSPGQALTQLFGESSPFMAPLIC